MLLFLTHLQMFSSSPRKNACQALTMDGWHEHIHFHKPNFCVLHLGPKPPDPKRSMRRRPEPVRTTHAFIGTVPTVGRVATRFRVDPVFSTGPTDEFTNTVCPMGCYSQNCMGKFVVGAVSVRQFCSPLSSLALPSCLLK